MPENSTIPSGLRHASKRTAWFLLVMLSIFAVPMLLVNNLRGGNETLAAGVAAITCILSGAVAVFVNCYFHGKGQSAVFAALGAIGIKTAPPAILVVLIRVNELFPGTSAILYVAVSYFLVLFAATFLALPATKKVED